VKPVDEASDSTGLVPGSPVVPRGPSHRPRGGEAGLAEQVAEARRWWTSKHRRNKAFAEVTAALATMSSGRARCMYCEDSAGTDIDHFRPLARYPERAYTWSNYLWACSRCNSNDKRDRFPLAPNGDPMVLDPTADDPLDHLAFSPHNGHYVALTDRGRASIDVFRLNDDGVARQLARGRVAALASFRAHLAAYDAAIDDGRPEDAERAREAILDLSFSAVIHHVVRQALDPDAALVLPFTLVDPIRRHRVGTWGV
jgi:uncharacterized protein (TIGR02646 family)